MGTKSLWQSMTDWMGKSAGAPSTVRSAIPDEPQPRESAARSDASFEQRPATPNPQAPEGSVAGGALNPSAGGPATPAAAGAVPQSARENTEIEKKVIEIIKTCYDPEIPVNIYELGLIYDVKVDEQQAHVKMTLTAPNCPAAQSLPAEVKHKIEAMDEINSASVEIVFDPPWHPNNMSDSAKLVLNIL
jgi:FeS assembly SUF system protein